MSAIGTTKALNDMLGQNGFTYIDDTNKVIDNFNAIQVIETCVVTTEGDVLPSINLGEGQIVVGRFTSVQLSEGRVICYKS